MKPSILSTVYLALAPSLPSIFGRNSMYTPLIHSCKSISKCYRTQSKKEKAEIQPILKHSFADGTNLGDDSEDEEDVDYDDELLFDDGLMEDELPDEFEDEFEEEEEEEEELRIGDGCGGGGVSLAGTSWDKESLRIAEQVCASFNGELGIYAFKTLSNSTIQVRIERLTNKSGSPDMNDLERFSRAYRTSLDEAEAKKMVPESIILEVSSPGVERVVRVPDDLERFKERPMYVKYVKEEYPSSEMEGVFRLISFEMEERLCTWGLANVRVNREKAGKGRPLSKKQKEWCIVLPFSSLILVKIYSDC